MIHDLKKILIIAVATVVLSITMTLFLVLGMEFILSLWTDDSPFNTALATILVEQGHVLGKLIITTTVLIWVSLTVYMYHD